MGPRHGQLLIRSQQEVKLPYKSLKIPCMFFIPFICALYDTLRFSCDTVRFFLYNNLSHAMQYLFPNETMQFLHDTVRLSQDRIRFLKRYENRRLLIRFLGLTVRFMVWLFIQRCIQKNVNICTYTHRACGYLLQLVTWHAGIKQVLLFQPTNVLKIILFFI